jgi:hypothetical protein
MGNMNAYRILVGKPEGRSPLGRPTHGWYDNIEIDFVERVWGGMDWSDLAQNRAQWKAFVNAVMSLRIP